MNPSDDGPIAVTDRPDKSEDYLDSNVTAWPKPSCGAQLKGGHFCGRPANHSGKHRCHSSLCRFLEWA